MRRSERHKLAPTRWWKGERVVYECKNDEVAPDTAVALQLAEPTPAPKRCSSRGRRRSASSSSGAGNPPLEPLSPSELTELPDGQRYETSSEVCTVWVEETAECIQRRIITRTGSLKATTLQPTAPRPPGREGAGLASQAFNVAQDCDISPWMSGMLTMPPRAIKDPEHVAMSTQLCWVQSCQDRALELAVAMPAGEGEEDGEGVGADSARFDPQRAQRYLLSGGDHFMVPINNIYRLENHSREAEAV
ncbi:unnamed protein product, partial [Phaeothamnion confervicola]